jgi:hypothetical protein
MTTIKMTKQESVRIIKQFKSMLNYTDLFQEVDANAETENFGLEFGLTNVVFYLPSDEYPTWQLSFDDRGITTNIEEFDTFTEAVDYLIEQVQNECV